jgi:Domain of unknown function (DUF4139)/N-terminal domain of unknown function (DUF4140)
MNASLWLAAALACAQLDGPADQTTAKTSHAARTQAENPSPPRQAVNRIVAVTVYQGQALVTREVSVPEGEGNVELIVSPLPPQTVDNSLYTEGADGLRVLSTRFRSRAVKEDTRQDVRAKQDLLKQLSADAQKIQNEIAVQDQDLQYLQKLEGFTGTMLTGLTRQGRLDSEAILSLSKFIMDRRAAKANSETDLNQRLQANKEAAEFARKQLAELSAGSGRIERDAVVVVSKSRPAAGTVRLGYLVSAATWTPQYRLRGAADNAPVRLEYLAAVVQQTGEDWPAVRATLSTARPSLDAAPPDFLPLTMAIADTADSGPLEAKDDRSQKITAELGKLIDMQFPNETPLEDVIKYIRSCTKSATYPEGIPIYVDPIGLQEAEKAMTSPVTFDVKQVALRTSLPLILKQLALGYQVKGGLLTITSQESLDEAGGDHTHFEGSDLGLMTGMGGMGGMGLSLEQAQSAGGAMLNQAAATDQAKELRIADKEAVSTTTSRDGPSVAFPISGPLTIPSRRDPQLLEVARVQLPADHFAKATPVLTPRVYRLAKLTNQSDLVLLPGEATVYVGSDFVGRMNLPLVAAGEPFVAGFGVDPQLQVSRRLVHKARSVQGGNQVFDYEFRLGLRNYRNGPVKIELWDRLPRPQGEAVAVSLVKTSAELSTDALYLRTARMDNLLRWDMTIPQGTVGDKTVYVNYEFRLEYSRDLPQPRFISGGLREGPIGGGAMGGMGGMMGGMRSMNPTHP